MGSSNISAIGKMFVQNQTAGGVSQDEDTKVKFAEVMSQMAGMVGNGLQTGGGMTGDDRNFMTVEHTASEEGYDRCQHREILRADGARPGTESEKVLDKLEHFADDVKEVLQEELGVTEEQIKEAMEALGLSFADLMNPNQLAVLVMKLTGAEDIGALLCNSEFLTAMQAVSELGEALLRELGISMEELTQMLQAVPETEQVEVMTAEEQVAHEMLAGEQTAVTEQVEKSAQPAEQTAAAEEAETDESVITETAEEHITLKNGENAADETLEEQTAEEGEALLKTVDVTERGGTAANRNHMSDNQNPNTAGNGVAAAKPDLAEMAGIQQTERMPEFASQLDVADIIRQISEYSKVTFGNAATTLEMQLNPENLGKLYLEITSKDGIVSAHITAQNEAVKEALESQLVELRQNMNQSGVKVEAVEVSVGSHEFEKNLEQNARQQEQQAEEQEKAAKQTRRINLNDLDELGGLMTEEENLVAQMMADQGNSVDFTA